MRWPAAPGLADLGAAGGAAGPDESVAAGAASCAAGGNWVRGITTVASGDAAAARGITTVASGGQAPARGITTVASDDARSARGISTVASSDAWPARGISTVALRSGVGGGASVAGSAVRSITVALSVAAPAAPSSCVVGQPAWPSVPASLAAAASSSRSCRACASLARSAATLRGRSAGRGCSIQSTQRRKGAEQPGSAAVWSASGGISSTTVRVVAGVGARPSSKKCSVAPSE